MKLVPAVLQACVRPPFSAKENKGKVNKSPCLHVQCAYVREGQVVDQISKAN